MNELIAREYDALGEERVKPFFVADRTHTTLEGAKFNARVAIDALRRLPKNPVAAYLLDEAAARQSCSR